MISKTAPSAAALPIRQKAGVDASRSRSVNPIRSGSGSRRRSFAKRGWIGSALVGSAIALAAAALYNNERSRRAERKYPPIGRFLNVDGVRLHYIERGHGEPIVLIHGNGTMIQDFTVSGLVDRLAERYRVIIFDRPGYGYSTRPRRLWTPGAYASLYRKALAQLGIEKTLVLGHSWGTLVAISLALQHPDLVRSLVLASGYYYATARLDTVLFSPPAIPVIGDVMRYTVSPLAARLLMPRLIRKMFAPMPVPERFHRLFPSELMLRPVQIAAAAEDAALMTPSAIGLEQHYKELRMPTVIVTGAEDQVADVGRQSERLHRELQESELIVIPRLGHMFHHVAPDQMVAAIDRLAHEHNCLPDRKVHSSAGSSCELPPSTADRESA